MRSFIVVLIDLAWLAAALGLVASGGIVLFKKRSRWKHALGFVGAGAALLAARYIGWLWDAIHQCVGA